MAAIDQYKHRLLGFIECPSSENFVYNNSTRQIAIYIILQDIPAEENNFDGKTGDILLGGGKGEAAAMRLSIPKIFDFFTNPLTDFKTRDEIFKTFWTPTESYIFCEGYAKIGWTSKQLIEFWLAENITFLLTKHFDMFKQYTLKDIATTKIKFEIQQTV